MTDTNAPIDGADIEPCPLDGIQPPDLDEGDS